MGGVLARGGVKYLTELEVMLGSRSYQIMIGSGLLPEVGELVGDLVPGRRALVVSDETVFGLYGGTLEDSLKGAGFEVEAALVPPGEEHKTLAWTGQLYERAFEAGLDRFCPVIALGGGVVGDLAGFAAATYMRGVPFVQLPTTLLAQVDSSVGGKVAVNHPRGKNAIGAFYQPVLVASDVDTLASLPARQVRSGLAEVIKYGVIWDEKFFAWLEENVDRLLNKEVETMVHAVSESCRIKAQVVEEDETERGLRAILNFGHTVGHALEAAAGYGTYTHGEAVAAGMAAEARLALKSGLLAPRDYRRLIALLKRAGLPAELPGGVSPERIVSYMWRDKKVKGGRLTFVLPSRIGKAVIKAGVSEGEVLRYCFAGR